MIVVEVIFRTEEIFDDRFLSQWRIFPTLFWFFFFKYGIRLPSDQDIFLEKCSLTRSKVGIVPCFKELKNFDVFRGCLRTRVHGPHFFLFGHVRSGYYVSATWLDSKMVVNSRCTRAFWSMRKKSILVDLSLWFIIEHEKGLACQRNYSWRATLFKVNFWLMTDLPRLLISSSFGKIVSTQFVTGFQKSIFVSCQKCCF